MAKTPAEQHEEKEKRRARTAKQAAAQRGPVAPEFGRPVNDTLDEHPPHEQVSRLGTRAEDAEAELRRRQRSDFEGQTRPRQRFTPGKVIAFVVLGLIVLIGGIWGIFFSSS